MSLEGIDVSEFQTSVNWHDVRNDGKRFAFVRVHNGSRVDHLATEQRVEAIRAAGLFAGAYAYVVPGNGKTAKQQWDEFSKHARTIGLLRRGSLRPVIDIEESRYDLSTLRGRFLTRLFVARWVKHCFRDTGVHPIIYTGKWFWDSARFSRNYRCRLWLAAYVPAGERHKYLPRGFDHVAFWQYSGHGRIRGVRGDVDLDRYLGSVRELRKYHTLGHNA